MSTHNKQYIRVSEEDLKILREIPGMDRTVRILEMRNEGQHLEFISQSFGIVVSCVRLLTERGINEIKRQKRITEINGDSRISAGDLLIEEFFSVRTANLLIEKGYSSLGDLISRERCHPLSIRGFGFKKMAEIKTILGSFNCTKENRFN